MAAEMRSVFSSHIDSIGYDSATGDLIVKWQRGKTSAYSGVDPEKAKQVMNAPSVGEALAAQIKPNYTHRYL